MKGDLKFDEIYFELVHEVLNVYMELGLLPNVATTVQGRKYTFDFVDQRKQVYVLIKNINSSKERGKLAEEVHANFIVISRSHPNARLILVFTSQLSNPDTKYFKNYFEITQPIKLTIFDLKEIIEIAQENNVTVDDSFKELHRFPRELENSNTFQHSSVGDVQRLIEYIKPRNDRRCWWINVSEEVWPLEEYKVNEIKNYPIRNENGAERQRISEVDIGELLIGYQKKPELRIITLFECVESSVDGTIGLKVLYIFKINPTWRDLTQIATFRNSPIYKSRAIGSVHHLAFDLFDIIINLTELGNTPLTKPQQSFQDSSRNNINSEPPNNFVEAEDETSFQLPQGETDKIPFHFDQVETLDRLNRNIAAKSLARLINSEIFASDGLNSAFMIHLQGEWGDGKSTFLNLLEQNLNSKSRNWIFVKYNAWRNQHIDPPWWAFLNDVYRQTRAQFTCSETVYLWLCENWRRLIKYQSLKKVTSFSLSLFFIYLIFEYRNAIFDFSSTSLAPGKTQHEAKGISLGIFATLITSIGAFIGLLYTFSKFISAPFFLNSASTARTFVEKSTDPMKKVKNHFEGLVDNISCHGYPLAVFIDDLDRCNDQYVVSLLEGIQTLFKDRKVLFVVAGDKQWICQCFENHYQKYQGVARKPGQKLGYLFIEKAFQLSIRLPKISVATKKDYWNYILNIKGNTNEIPLNDDKRLELINVIKSETNKDVYFNTSYIKDMQAKYNTNSNEIVDAVLEVLDNSDVDVKHRLVNHYELIDANPRSIKRLTNEYIMYRNILFSEQKEFNRDKLFRWLILVNKYPEFTDWLEANPASNLDDLPADLRNIERTQAWKKLLFDSANKYGGRIQLSEIALFNGFPNTD